MDIQEFCNALDGGYHRFAGASHLSDNPSYKSLLQGKSGGERKLDLGSIAHRSNHSDPRDVCGVDGPRWNRDQGTAGDSEACFAAPYSDNDWYRRGGRTVTGGATRD